MLFFPDVLNSRRDRALHVELFGRRRQFIIAGLSVITPPVSQAELHDKHRNVICIGNKENHKSEMNASGLMIKKRGKRRFFFCKECLIRRAAERSAFVNKEK